MNNIYIRTNNRKYENFAGKFQKYYNEIFHITKVEEINSGKLIIIPCNYMKRKLKIIRKIKKNIENEKSYRIIYSKEIDDDIKLNNALTNITGKKLMKKNILKILNYIYKISDENMELYDIYIFVNEYCKDNLYVIEALANYFKTVNIITNNISKFRIQERKYEKENILLTISNNKRKSAKKSRIIINIDFNNDTLEKYSINKNAILINLNNEKVILKNNFNGIIINDYNIKVNEDFEEYIKEYYGDINLKLFIESNMENKYKNIVDIIDVNNDIKIKELVGIRGIITNKEIIQNFKN